MNKNDRELKKLSDALISIRAKAYPYAVANATNSIMFKSQKEWRQGMSQSMTLRNDFTQKAVVVQMVRAKKRLTDIAGYVGADRGGLNKAGEYKRAYIGLNETGGTVDAKGRPANRSRKGGYASPLKRSRYMGNLNRPNEKHKKGRDRKQRNAIAMYYADKERKPTTLELTNNDKYGIGIFTAKKRGKRRTKGGRKNAAVGMYNLKLLWLTDPHGAVEKKASNPVMHNSIESACERYLVESMIVSLKRELEEIKRRKKL